MIAADREPAFAKVNLALHVRERMLDGYHRLETLFAFAGDGDLLEVAPSPSLSLAIEGEFASALDDAGDNLVLKAGAALRGRHGVRQGAALRLVKRLPVAAGLGGGSADAAAALRLLSRFWGIDAADDLTRIASTLGADVPACLESRSCVGLDRGDRLVPVDLPGLAGMPVLLVNPRVPLSTAAVFGGWDGVDRGALDPRRWREGRNDLTAPAAALVPEISDILIRLRALRGVSFAAMSGSGATCLALFDDARARDAAASAFPDCWTLASRLR